MARAVSRHPKRPSGFGTGIVSALRFSGKPISDRKCAHCQKMTHPMKAFCDDCIKKLTAVEKRACFGKV